jgi:hypothetical protein
MSNVTTLHKYMHISIDDVYFILKELDEGSYRSIFEHKVFKFFKDMHDTYGTVFSLYCFYHISETDDWTLANMTDRFKDEFKNAASWLKFGFHSDNSIIKYNELIDPDKALKHYNKVINAIKYFAGSTSIDRMPRTHYFSGTVEIVRKWRDADNGIEGFLTADDNRDFNYYLNADERTLLLKHSDYFEAREKLYFFKTNLRLEKAADPYEMLELAKVDKSQAGQQALKIIFTHENYLYGDDMLKKIEAC